MQTTRQSKHHSYPGLSIKPLLALSLLAYYTPFCKINDYPFNIALSLVQEYVSLSLIVTEQSAVNPSNIGMIG
jgi:hypothetical protein